MCVSCHSLKLTYIINEKTNDKLTSEYYGAAVSVARAVAAVVQTEQVKIIVIESTLYEKKTTISFKINEKIH